MSEFTLLFSAPINNETANALAQVLANLTSNKITKLTLAVNSGGGEVVAGIFAYNVILSTPIEITTHNVGNVDSIANVIFLAGARRLAVPSSTFMFHSVGFDPGTERLEEKNLTEKLDTIQAEHKRISEILAARTQLSVDEGKSLFAEQRTKNVDWARSKGLIHDVGEFKMPTDGTFHTIFG